MGGDGETILYVRLMFPVLWRIAGSIAAEGAFKALACLVH